MMSGRVAATVLEKQFVEEKSSLIRSSGPVG